jgi:hypothetical protein
VTQWRSDLTGRQDAGGDLVEQRLEQVVVSTVDEGDVDREPAEEPARRQPAEASADDDDPMAGVGRRDVRAPLTPAQPRPTEGGRHDSCLSGPTRAAILGETALVVVVSER